MKNLPIPQFTAKQTFSICISKVRDLNLKNRLAACEQLVIDAETEFANKILKGNVFTITKETIVNKDVSAKELEKVYTNRMAKNNVVGRWIYDKIISAPELDICPLCNQRQVDTLDHYLPKSDFPRLSVTPINLIPACFSCNKKKASSVAKITSEETLHPYYDNIENDAWIFAKVNKTSPPSLTFFTDTPLNWSLLLRKRVEHHFDFYKLNNLYSIQSAVLLRNLSSRLTEIHMKSGLSGVRKYLKLEADSRQKVDLNSWQTVFYSTVYDDKWFCDGGFRF